MTAAAFESQGGGGLEWDEIYKADAGNLVKKFFSWWREQKKQWQTGEGDECNRGD